MSLVNEIVGMLDADVLFPMPLCDTLLLLAEERLFSPRWSSQILEEVRRNLVQSKRCTPAQALRRVTVVDDAFPEALVEDYEQVIPELRNHEKDRHVAAAAIHGKVDVIVTQNLRDFPSEALAPWGLRAVGPDRFLLDLLDAAPGNDLRTARCIVRQAHSLKRPSMTHYDVLDRLADHAPAFAARMRELLNRGGIDFSLLLLESE
jgi:hypothetical protein